VIDDQIRKFHEEDGAQWPPETWTKFSRLIDRKAQKKPLAPVSHVFDPSSDSTPEACADAHPALTPSKVEAR
jgi:hypothetical protein